MKPRTLITPIVLLVFGTLAGCAQATPAPATSKPAAAVQPMPASVTTKDPIGIVKAYMDTANTGDYAKTLAFYAEDAVVYNPLGVFVGKNEIAKWLTNDVTTTRVQPKDVKMQGSMVVVTGTVSLDRFQKAGVGDVAFTADYMVDNGKIRFFSPTVQLTADQQAKMKAALANAPAAPTPQISPEDVAKAYVDAANAGDFNKAISYYADDAAALVMNNTLLLSGKDQVSSWLQNDVKSTRANPQNWQGNGNVVINTGTVSLARFTQLGIDSVQYQSVYVVENGMIRLFWPTLILTPDQLAKIQSAQSAPTKAP